MAIFFAPSKSLPSPCSRFNMISVNLLLEPVFTDSHSTAVKNVKDKKSTVNHLGDFEHIKNINQKRFLIST